MASTRREVLVSGGVIGAGVLAADFSILDAFAGPTPPKRVSLHGLAWNDPIVETYRDGVDMMQKLPANNVFNWSNLAHIHGSSTSAYHFCPHRNWYFLPWHRAYVVTYEKAIRKLMSNNNFAMPYWDWTSHPEWPDQFLNPTLPNNKPNALFVGSPHARNYPANSPIPSNFVGQSVYQQILQATPFEVFGTSRPLGQNNTSQSWITTSTGLQGKLEATPHNNVHNLVGGWMPTALSPMDPIFFMHHCNIDRIWAVWNHAGNSNSSDPLWTGMTFQNNFYKPDGTPWSPVVSSLYVPEDLGYTYGLGLRLTVPSKYLVLMENKLIQLIKYLKNPGGPVEGIKVFELARGQIRPPIPRSALALPVKVDAGLVSKVRMRPRLQNLAVEASPRAAAEAQAPGTHAYALLRDVDASAPENAEYRVFLNADRPTAETPLTDPHFVGSIGIFSHGMASMKGMEPSFMLDLTDVIGRVGAEGGTLNVQVVPVPLRPGLDPGTVNAGSIQIAFVTP